MAGSHPQPIDADATPAPGLPAPAESAPDSEAPDTRLGVPGPDGRLVAHAALWWSRTPALPGATVGCIGGFAAAGEAAARDLLDAACGRLAAAGCTLAVGPLNGNTWRRHRFVTEPGTRPPFFLEPWNPPEWPHWWRAAGFAELAGYSSSRLDLDHELPVPARVRARLAAAGIRLRPLAVEAFEAELRSIHRLCLDAFAGNFLYTPLDEDEFVTSYARVKPLVRGEFVRVAECDGEPCGFVFALPDQAALARGEAPDLIVKTLAVRSDRRSFGLGSLLVAEVQAAARQAGLRHAVHALQHESNSSLRITARGGGERLRRYALFARPLAPR